MIRFVLLLVASFLLMAARVDATERFMTNNGQTSGSCLTPGTACRFDYVMTLTNAGDTVTMACGTYQGANNMIALYPNFAGKSGTSVSRITLRAATDGCVFIDGQFSNNPFVTDGNDYWTFSGFDMGNSPNSVLIHFGSTHGIFQRICASNADNSNASEGNQVLWVWNSSDNLFEDICAFGTGRNTMETFADGTSAFNSSQENVNLRNTYRRVWLRFEGANSNVGERYTLQTEYWPGSGGSPTNGGDIYENMILVYQPDQDTSGVKNPGSSRRGFSTAETRAGWIVYGKAGAASPSYPWFLDYNAGQALISNLKDIFVDGLSQPVQPFLLVCSGFGNCSSNSADRLTALRHSSAGESRFEFSNQTNINECQAAAACPNIYTGGSPGTGSRACFRYVDGVLTSTPLWPWPMDDRIKAALARANAAGTGGAALAGDALAGAYEAATVTSEIVNRYGSVPTACLTSGSFTPAFPVASDFPSVTVRDDFNRVASTLGSGWTELLSDTFSASNAAVAPSTGSAFARAVYSDTQLQPSHEVYATWTTLPATGSFSTIISFAGTDLTVNNQYRVRVNRTASTNTLVEVQRIDSGGSGTVILSGVDLGIEAVDGNSFGVRVSGTTISVYWKWTDGVWYRIGQFTDANLPTSGGVYGGIAGGSPAVIDNYGAGPFVDQPEQEPPTPPASVGAGRFGTTFPGVR